MNGLSPRAGDIVVVEGSTTGRLWRVLAVTGEIVRAETVDAWDGRRVVSQHDATTLHVTERHPGGAGGTA